MPLSFAMTFKFIVIPNIFHPFLISQSGPSLIYIHILSGQKYMKTLFTPVLHYNFYSVKN